MFSPDEALARARKAMGIGTKYKLGASTPGKECDCSGLTCYAYGYSRKDLERFGAEDGGWHFTDAIVADALDDQDFYKLLDKPEAGCLIVFPGIRKGGARVRIGHIGIVSHVPVNWDGDFAKLLVIHCSSGNYRARMEAICETNAKAWRGREVFRGVRAKRWGTIFVRPLP